MKRGLMGVGPIDAAEVWDGLGLYHKRAASHGIYVERPGEPGWGAVLFTRVYGCSWFSFGFAVCVFFGLLIGGLFGLLMAKL